MFWTRMCRYPKHKILCSVTSLPPPLENRAVYEIMWGVGGNMVEPDRVTEVDIIRRMRVRRSMTETTDIHAEYVILKCFSTAKIVT